MDARGEASGVVAVLRDMPVLVCGQEAGHGKHYVYEDFGNDVYNVLRKEPALQGRLESSIQIEVQLREVEGFCWYLTLSYDSTLSDIVDAMLACLESEGLAP